MNFGDLKAALTDRHGITLDSGAAGRLVNTALDRVALAANWKELEFTANLAFTSGSQTATLGTDMRAVLGVLDQNGVPLDEKTVDAWEDLYEGDPTTGTPSAYCVYEANSSGTIIVKLWPIPNASVTGKVKGLRRPALLVNDADVPQLPPELHHLILKEAVALYRGYEESELAPLEAQGTESASGRAAGVKERV